MPDSFQNTERLLGSLISKVDGIDKSLKEFKEDFDRELREVKNDHQQRLNNHGGRIAALESDRDRREGGMKMLTGLLSAAVAVGTLLGSLLSTVIGKLWP